MSSKSEKTKWLEKELNRIEDAVKKLEETVRRDEDFYLSLLEIYQERTDYSGRIHKQILAAWIEEQLKKLDSNYN